MYTAGEAVLGTVADDSELLPHLSGVYSFTLGKSTSAGETHEELKKAVSTYRLFGWDTRLSLVGTKISWTPWAAAHSCVVEEQSIIKEEDDDLAVKILRATPRNGRHADFFEVPTLRAMGTVLVSITQPVISFKISEQRMREADVAKVKTVRSKMPKMMVSPQSIITTHTLLPVIKSKREEQDFQRVIPEASPPHPPLTAAIASGIAAGMAGIDDVPDATQQSGAETRGSSVQPEIGADPI
jgi:hypothetical protein